MKRLLAVLLALCVLCSGLVFTVSAEDAPLQTVEFEGKTYINVTSKAVLDSLVADLVARREYSLDIYYYPDQRDWSDEYARRLYDITGLFEQTYYTYTVASSAINSRQIYLGDGVFTEEAYGTIDIRYVDTKEETAKAISIIDGVLAQISSLSLVEKMRYVADYVCKCTEYGSIIIDGGYDIVNGACDVLTGVRTNTVCTSYALTFQLFMDRAGIPCTMICNDNHIWNMVKVGDLWYGIDCTSDIGDGIQPEAFLMGMPNLSHLNTGRFMPLDAFSRTRPISPTNYSAVSSSTSSQEESSSSSRPTDSDTPVSSSPASQPVSSTASSEETTASEDESTQTEEVTADLTETTAVKGDLFRDAAEKKADLKLVGDTYQWLFAADDLSGATVGEAFDAAILVGDALAKEQVALIEQAADGAKVYPFAFAHHGALPSKATVSLQVDASFAGEKVDVFSLDDSNTPVLESTVTVSSDATLTFATTHCSLWYITSHVDAEISEDGNVSADTDTGTTGASPASFPWMWVILGGVLLIAVAGVAVFLLCKKKQRNG